MRRIPQIVSVMTPFPYSVEIGDSVIRAREMMAEHDIRHLPVKEDGRLVAVVSERDIGLALGAGRAFPSEGHLRVRDVCSREVYIVETSERLDHVLAHMADTHIGSAIVVKNGRLAGIFTTTDACRAFADALHEWFGPPGGDEAA